MNLIQSFKAARRVSAPLLAINEPDHAAAIRHILGSFKEQPAALQWDCVCGMQGANKKGGDALAEVASEADTTHYLDALNIAKKLPGARGENKSGAILFMLNAHRFIQDIAFVQAVWNLRDQYKQDRRTLILLGTNITLPPELTNDIVALEQPLPTDKEIEEIIVQVYSDAGKELPPREMMAKSVDATTGLASFMIEQVSAMSLQEDGMMDIPSLWERKRKAIEQTKGLKVWRGGESFASIGGLANLKTFLGKYVKGKKRPRVIVFIDEIEKALAGFQGDSSGTTQDQVGSILSFMQDERCDGIILYGPAGTGKSNIAKATGNEAEVPIVAMDLGGMKDSHVGDTEANTRAALKAIKAMGQDRILFIATCNGMTTLPPELRRRFKSGTFFLDLPNAEERQAIWRIFIAKHGLTAKQTKNPASDEGWTGAEIETCCEYAGNFECTLAEAAAYIVPVSKSASEIVQGLRRNANGRYISAHKPGVYQFQESEQPTGKRMLSGEE